MATRKSNTKKTVGAGGGAAKVLTNCTATPRGIMLDGEHVVLRPLEVKALTDKQHDALKALFGSRTFRKFADTGIFRLSGMSSDEQPVNVPAPQAPAELTAPVAVDGVTAAVGTESGTKATAPKAAGTVTIE